MRCYFNINDAKIQNIFVISVQNLQKCLNI
nr:MAG TPA: hypothetical protein [Caudoviricetes sp.]